MTTIISGTNRKNSMTLKIARIYHRYMSEGDDQIHLLSLEDKQVWNRNEDLLALEKEFLIPSQKFVLVVPEYNGSIPGILKLLIDNSEIRQCWWFKKAMLVGIADGRGGNLRGLDHLTNILHYLKMNIFYNKLPISRINEEITVEGQIRNPLTEKAIKDQIEAFKNFQFMSSRIILILILLAGAEYYSFLVVRSATRFLPQSARVTINLIYVLVSLLTWAGLLFFRKVDWGSLPPMGKTIYVAFTIGLLIGKILILAIMLGDEFRRGLSWVLSKFQGGSSTAPAGAAHGLKRSDFLIQLALLAGAGSVGSFLYGISNRYRYRIRRLNLTIRGLPDGFRGLKFVQISDIHSGSFDNQNAVKKGLEMIMSEQPDLILFTGDLVNNESVEILPYKDLFSSLKAPLGVFSILGNHDYGDYHQWPSAEAKAANLKQLVDIQKEMGWKLLRNEHVVLEKGGDQLALIGVENWSSELHFPKYGNLGLAMQGTEKIPFKILMSHDPSHWEAEVKGNTDIPLTLSGHTHGMQFGIEIPGFKWSPAQYVYKRWAGYYREGTQALYVNRGFGFLGYSGRLGILPEITVFTLS